MFQAVSEKEVYLHFEKFFSHREPIRKKARNMIPKKCRLLLDLGCKNGTVTSSYFKQSQKTIGFDRDYNQLLTAWKNYPQIRFINGDASFLPFKDSCVEVIVSTEILQYIPEIEKIFYEAHRVLRPGGFLIVSLPQKGIISKYIKYLNYDKLKTILRNKEFQKKSDFYLHSFKDIENLSKKIFSIKKHEKKGFIIYPISYFVLRLLIRLTYELLPSVEKQEKYLILCLLSKIIFLSYKLLFWFIGLLMIIDSNLSFWKFSYSLIILLEKVLPEKTGD